MTPTGKIERPVVDKSVDDIGVVLRPSLRAFAVEMEWKLRKNDHKKGWRDLPIEALQRLFQLEYEEFKVAMDYFGPGAARKESIDCANFMMMIWDRLGMLDDKKEEDVYVK